jgi:uncharacterized C2H2 Zn-finger protein
MEPRPDQILTCPHCKALYRRSSDFDENGLDHWSDGKLCVDITVDYYLDPVVRCTNCAQLFVTAKANTKNIWGFNIPKDIKFHAAHPLTLEDCQTILKDESMLRSIGIFPALYWFMDTEIDTANNEGIRLAGEISMRIAIWTKLNDLKRYQDYTFTKTEKQLYQENDRTLLRIIPNQVTDQELLLTKAELHRNLGQFLKSLLTLRRIKSSSNKYARKRMIRLNLLLNPKLAKLNRVLFRRTKLGRTLEQVKYKLDDLVDWFSFRKK